MTENLYFAGSKFLWLDRYQETMEKYRDQWSIKKNYDRQQKRLNVELAKDFGDYNEG